MTFRKGPNIVSNTGRHEHRPIATASGPTCQDCGQIIITPVLSQEDFNARITANAASEEQRYVAEYLSDLRTRVPIPLDYLLMDLASNLETPWPPYVVMVGERYKNETEFGGMPPHTQNGLATDWWVTE